jgi:membrane-associated phospholipid phosphatase
LDVSKPARGEAIGRVRTIVGVAVDSFDKSAVSGTGLTWPWLVQRPYDNLRSYLRLLAHRASRRRSVFPSWLAWAALALGLILPVANIVDPIFGAHRTEINPTALQVAIAINEIGSSRWMYSVLGAAIIVALFLNWRRPGRLRLLRRHAWTVSAIYALTAIATQEILVTILKQLFGRARPNLFETAGPFHAEPWSFAYDFTSFPSGHAATIGCAAACVALLFPRYRAVAALAAIWIGFSRVVIGAHYPSDVVAGLMFGAWIAYATAFFFARFGVLFVTRPGRAPAPPPHIRAALSFVGRSRPTAARRAQTA